MAKAFMFVWSMVYKSTMSHQDRRLFPIETPWPAAERRHAQTYVFGLLAGLWIAKSLHGIPLLGMLLANVVVASQLLLPLHRIDHHRLPESTIGWTLQGWTFDLLLWLTYSFFWLGSLECLFAITSLFWPTIHLQPLTWPSGSAKQLVEILHLLLQQFLAVALPEELFFRGYLRTLWPHTTRQGSLNKGFRFVYLPIAFDRHALAIAFVFALSHMVGEWHVGRLLTFFPALIFVRLFDHHHRILAPVLFHVTCNLWSMLRLMPIPV